MNLHNDTWHYINIVNICSPGEALELVLYLDKYGPY